MALSVAWCKLVIGSRTFSTKAFGSGILYWTDTGTDRIEVASIDGKARRVLVSRGLDEPTGIALDPVNGWMYWSDWGKEAKIERAWMDGSHREAIITEDITWPNGDTETRTLKGVNKVHEVTMK